MDCWAVRDSADWEMGCQGMVKMLAVGWEMDHQGMVTVLAVEFLRVCVSGEVIHSTCHSWWQCGRVKTLWGTHTQGKRGW